MHFPTTMIMGLAQISKIQMNIKSMFEICVLLISQNYRSPCWLEKVLEEKTPGCDAVIRKDSKITSKEGQ